MPGYPYLTDLLLQPCCKEALDKINRNLKDAGIKQILINLPFFNVLGGQNTSFITVTNTNWIELLTAMASVPPVTREMNREIAFEEVINHHSSGRSHVFWQGLVEAMS